MIIQCPQCQSQGIVEYHEDKRKEVCNDCKGNGYVRLAEEQEAYGISCRKGDCDT